MTDSGNFIIDFSVYDAIRAGFDHVVFIIKEENLELFRETIGNRIEKKIRVSYVFQSVDYLPEGLTLPEGRTKPWGTGHAIYCAKDAVQEQFAVINADDFYGRDTFVQLAKHLSREGLDGKPAHHCMVGFRVGNTLTENGTVSRGVCSVDAEGMLREVVERTKIEKREGCAAYLNDDGESWTEIGFDTIVSMNCWGFTPDIFEKLEAQFRAFYAKNVSNPLKSEFYLPFAVQGQKDEGLCDVRVYPTQSHWYGVTYAEDKERVKSAIQAMLKAGEYPADLWAD
jgi:NDP-sugar pyrophosphorylase family protein